MPADTPVVRTLVEPLLRPGGDGDNRDLKPENCIYSTGSEDSLKITDFGLAAITQPGEGMFQDRHLVGTPGYIAPEVLNHYLYGPPR